MKGVVLYAVQRVLRAGIEERAKSPCGRVTEDANICTFGRKRTEEAY